MIFSLSWIQKFFSSPLPAPRKIASLLDNHLCGVEELEKREGGWVIDLEVKSNRPDTLSHLGIARELGVLLQKDLEEDPYTTNFSFSKSRALKVEIENKEDCPVYLGLVVRKAKVKESPPEIKKLLAQCGVGSVNNFVDLTNYVMLELGQPLHVFDLDKIEGTLVVRRAKRGERVVGLDNKEYVLSPKNLVIADKGSVLAIAGVKGGRKAEIDTSSQNLLIEAALFNRVTIRHSSRSLGLRSDASFRFEHGLYTFLPQIALGRIKELIERYKIGEVVGIVGFLPKKEPSPVIYYSPERASQILGFDIPAKEQERILRSLGCEIKKGKVWQVRPPWWRKDLSIPEDLIEEVGRIVGYENIPATPPKVSLSLPRKNLNVFWELKSKEILKELGLTEVRTYSFLNKEGLEVLGVLPETVPEVSNPVSERYTHLVPSLLYNLLRLSKENLQRGFQVRVFEIGKIYKRKPRDRFSEKKVLSVMLAKPQRDKELWLEVKGIVSDLLEGLGVGDYFFDRADPVSLFESLIVWHLGRCAEIWVGGERIGFLGEISEYTKAELKMFGVEVVAAELDFEKLVRYCSGEVEYQPLSPYPATIKDISVLVPKEVLVDEVLQVLQEAGGEMLKDVDLFDYYEGENIPQDKKSLAFRLILQAKDHTLTPTEIENILRKIITALEAKEGWEVRRLKEQE